MKTGTKSLLFGVHQFAWHPFTVWLAWVRLYREFPTWRECICILIHDWGYWGCEHMDDAKGEQHPAVGARLALWIFRDQKYHDLVLRHSRFLCKKIGCEPSKLCWADKFSMMSDPQWFYLIRARASGELAEYRSNADERGFMTIYASDRAWHSKLVQLLRDMSQEEAKKHQTAYT